MTADIDPVVAAARRAIKTFNWGNHGLDDMPTREPDWINALADRTVNAATRAADRQAKAASDRLLAESGLASAGPDGRGGFTIEVRLAADMAARMVQTAKAFLDTTGAENYVEQIVHDRETGERYTFTVQRPGKRTPHELRREAEGLLALRETQLAELAEALRTAAGFRHEDMHLGDFATCPEQDCADDLALLAKVAGEVLA